MQEVYFRTLADLHELKLTEKEYFPEKA